MGICVVFYVGRLIFGFIDSDGFVMGIFELLGKDGLLLFVLIIYYEDLIVERSGFKGDLGFLGSFNFYLFRIGSFYC